MQINYITIIGVIISLAIGYYLNDYANKKNNERLIAAFKAELEAYEKAKTSSRTSPAEKIAIEQKQQILQAQINLLQKIS